MDEAFLLALERHMKDFHAASKARNKLGDRIAQTTTLIIRVSSIGLVLIAPLLFYLIYDLTRNMADIKKSMDNMTVYMAGMKKDFSSVTGNMALMNAEVKAMEGYIEVIPIITESVAVINEKMQFIHTKMTAMASDMQIMRSNMTTLSVDVKEIDNTFAYLNHIIFVMRYDVNRFTRPMNFFPFF